MNKAGIATTVPESAIRPSLDSPAQRHMNEMSAYLEKIIELEGLSSFRFSLKLPRAILDLLTRAMECYDRYVIETINEMALKVSCHPGCSSCCRFELPSGVMSIEALNIYHFARSMDDIDDLYDKSISNATAFRHLLELEVRKSPGRLKKNDPRVRRAHIKYNGLGRPCPFLEGKSEKCRIYPVRPLVCRFYFSLSPSKWCHLDHEAYLHRKTMGIEISRQAKKLLRRINRQLSLRLAGYLPGAFAGITDITGMRPLMLV